MTRETKAAWIRRIFMTLLLGAAAFGGAAFVMPKDGNKVGIGIWLTKENIREVQGKEGVLTVTNFWDDDNKTAKKLRETLERLKKEKYADKIQLAELDIKEQKDLARELGVTDPDKFPGRLDFHSSGKKMGDLIGQSDPKIVEETIDRLLAQMVQRIDKNWVPEVAGMQRDKGQLALPSAPGPKAAAAAPAVPGMQRARGHQAAAPGSDNAVAAKKEMAVPGLERDHGQQILPLAPPAASTPTPAKK